LQGLFAHASNHLLKRGQLTIETTLMNEEEAKILQTNLPAAAFYLEHLFYDFEERPLSWGWFILRSEYLHFTAEIGIQEGRKDE
jgi:DNA-binding GntR family transcriptional regulator